MAFVIVVIAATALSGAVGTNEALSMATSSAASLASMRRYFVRSDEEHRTAMASISHRMDATSAMRVLENHGQASPVLVQLARRVLTTHSSSRKNTFLRASKASAPNYGNFKPALNLLNSMLYESFKKYDTEAAKCTDYYSKQCGMLEGIRGEIASSNYQSAGCREHSLAAQTQIDLVQSDVPNMQAQLGQERLKCKHEVHELTQRLKIVVGDIATLSKVLSMTECASKALLQVNFLRCINNCSQQSFVAVDHEDLQRHLSQLQSSVAIDLVKQGFSALSADASDEEEAEEETHDAADSYDPALKQPLNASQEPEKRTQVPESPCNDPYQGAPSPLDKRAAKCTVSGAPQCTKVQERFLLIQSGIQDERDDIQEEISHLERQCESMRENVETQIKDSEQSLKDEQTKLADSMTCEANAAEGGRLSNREHTEASADLKSMMKTCSGNYQNFETEICGLKKIRGELYKMRGSGKPAFFQDCQVSPWEEQECSTQCGGGVQQLTRSVATQPAGGAQCLPLVQMKSCHDMPCPVDCRLEAWAGWSKCSAECGGGVMQRLRDVKRHMKYNGKPCGETSETTACNVQSCESDCETSDWSLWGPCSKECDGGTRKRQKFIKVQAVGQGSCPGLWDKDRLMYEECNRHQCSLEAKALTLKCKAELDVVLLIDGSGSLGKKGWQASKKAAQTFVSAFEGDKTEARVSVILFSGPKSWKSVKKCFGNGNKAVDLKQDCSINIVQHFTKNMAMAKSKIKNLKWPRGSTLTSLALGAARTELSMGRKNAKSVVVVITDGRPMSFRKTALAARELRKSARLIWVPVTRWAPLKKMRKWATRRWQENVIPVKNFKDLVAPAVVSRLIADLCPLGGMR